MVILVRVLRFISDAAASGFAEKAESGRLFVNWMDAVAKFLPGTGVCIGDDIMLPREMALATYQ